MAKMTSRERVLAALDHQETDRIPIAMVCGGINPPAMQALDKFLQADRGIDAESYINSFLDVAEVWVTGDFDQELDMWGVARKAINYGAGTYSEIVHHPLRGMETLPHPEPTSSTRQSRRTGMRKSQSARSSSMM